MLILQVCPSRLVRLVQLDQDPRIEKSIRQSSLAWRRKHLLDSPLLFFDGSRGVFQTGIQLGPHLTHDFLNRRPDLLEDTFLLSDLLRRIGRRPWDQITGS